MRLRSLYVLVGAAAMTVACGQSDLGITTSVKSQLAADDMVSARTIDVGTRDRVVTLTGEVGSADERTRALEIARNTNGVTSVVDQLTVMAGLDAAPTTGTGMPGDPGWTGGGRDMPPQDPQQPEGPRREGF